MSSPIWKTMFLTFKLFFSNQVDSEYIPDISAKYPLCVSGRYHGKLPETLIARGQLADMSEISIELKVQHVKDVPLDKVRYSTHAVISTQLIVFIIIELLMHINQ